MSITRLQQARQLYATGQRVGRVAFQGGGASYSNPNEDRAREQAANQQRAQTFDARPASTNPNYSGGNANTGTVMGGSNETPQPRPNPFTDSGTSPSTYVPPSRMKTSPQFTPEGRKQMIQNLSPRNNNIISQYIDAGGMVGIGANVAGRVLGGIGNFLGGIGRKSNLERRRDFITKYNTSVPPLERINMTEDDILSAEGLASLKDIGYTTISDMNMPGGSDDNIPFWAQLGYPSYEAWASEQGTPVEDVIDDTETEDFVWRFAGNQPQDVRDRIEEEYKDYYTV